MSTGVELIPNLVTRVEENLKNTLGNSYFSILPTQNCNVVYCRTRLHVGIIPNEQIGRDLQQRLSELFLLQHVGHTEHLDWTYGESVILREEETFSGEWKIMYYSKSCLEHAHLKKCMSSLTQ